MNDVVITSSLGEPLIAQINITDVEKSPDTDCFSVTDISSPPAFTKALLTIKQQPNGYQLIIKSHQVITEPILNLHINHHCEPNINQDYVVLLDPPLQNDVNSRTDNQEVTNTPTHNQNKAANLLDRQTPVDSNTTQTSYSAKENISKKKKVATTASTSSIDKKLTAIYTGRPQTTTNPDSRDSTGVKSRPYLSISGLDSQLGEHLTLPKPALKLETQINLSRDEHALPLSTADVMDEITAIDNRLALLRTQIISLQDKNEKLKSDAEHAKKQLNDSKKTLRITAGLIALLALLTFAAWLRRKLIDERLAKAEHNRLNHSELTNTPDNFTDTALDVADKHTNDVKNSSFNDSFYENSSYDISSGFSAQPVNTASTTMINSNANEDILESVDVLIEYGRSGLAIHLLQDYLADHPSESPKVWLKLLSLAATHGSESDYTKAVVDCSHYYRIHMPSFAEAKKVGTATIEDFPYITKELEIAWGSAAALGLLDDLIHNIESQPEQGFEPEIFEQLFILKEIAEYLNNHPANTDMVAEQASINANEINPESNDTESSWNTSNNASSFTNLPIETVYETSSIELKTSINDSSPQNLSSLEAFPTLNFDDYVVEHNAMDTIPDNTAAQTTAPPELDENYILPETKPALEAPEIDFSQHLNEVADTHNNTPPVIENKQQKRNAKHSNLIDWVLTDET